MIKGKLRAGYRPIRKKAEALVFFKSVDWEAQGRNDDDRESLGDLLCDCQQGRDERRRDEAGRLEWEQESGLTESGLTPPAIPPAVRSFWGNSAPPVLRRVTR